MDASLSANLLAGAVTRRVATSAVPRVLVFDSGVGGLTVAGEIARARPDLPLTYVADDAAFPYGALDAATLGARVVFVMERMIARVRPDMVVIACNTAATIVLPLLRQAFPLPFVGTVPAIKPAVLASHSRMVSVLGTPGTVQRDYTKELVRAYAGDCRVDLVGSRLLAGHVEAELQGTPVADEDLLAELGPCFVTDGDRRTDTVVLACTHYPLLKARFDRIAPWPVAWIDPGPAIARRVAELAGPAPAPPHEAEPATAYFTEGRNLTPAMRAAFAAHGFAEIAIEALPPV